jgi:hypothetical protein
VDLNQFKTQYGTHAVAEMLDVVYITTLNKMTEADWRMYCVRHGIIKQTTKTVRRNYPYGYYAYDKTWKIALRNGASRQVLYLEFTNDDVEAYRKGE